MNIWIMKIFVQIAFFLMTLPVLAQDVTGIWRGYFNQVEYSRDLDGNKIAIPQERYKFEIQLDQQKGRFEGVTYSYLSTIFYGKATASGTVNQTSKKVLLEELKIVEVRMSGMSDACIMTCFLQYSKSGDEEFLEGTYTSMNIRDSTNCGRGTVFLRRVVTSDFYKEPFLARREKEKEEASKITPNPADKTVAKTTPVKKPPVTKPSATNSTSKKTTTTNNTKNSTSISTNKPATTAKKNVAVKPPPVTTKTNTSAKPVTPKTKDIKIASLDSTSKIDRKAIPVITPTPKALASRENEVVKTIITKSNEITINVYDNGSIDNDTVSVYLDKKLVISKQRLTTRAITFKFLLDDTNDYHELVMVAENLGEIPPNTSLMVVNAGNKQYEVRITSNEQKNAVVIFKYEKEK